MCSVSFLKMSEYTYFGITHFLYGLVRMSDDVEFTLLMLEFMF